MSIDKDRIAYLIKTINKGGDEADNAVHELYFSMGSIMFSLARTIVKNDYDAEEVVQNSLIKVVQNSDKFRFINNAYGWVLTIVRNTALNALKAQKLRTHSNIEDCAEPAQPPADIDSKITVQKVLGMLDEKERLVIAMKYFEDKTVRQIAFELRQPSSTVQSIISRAEKKLRKYIDIAHTDISRFRAA
jgi:RNA polymerase sigma-70 factor (ECF subfamily)